MSTIASVLASTAVVLFLGSAYGAEGSELTDGNCAFLNNTDIGTPDTILQHLPSITSLSQCCAACYQLADCSVSIVLDERYKMDRGCWLKTGEGATVSAEGKIACRTTRPPSHLPPAANLTLLPEAATKGRCMDGSVGGYYLSRNSSSTGWVLELQGG